MGGEWWVGSGTLALALTPPPLPPDPHQVGGERIARLVEALSCLPGESLDPHPHPPTLTLPLTRTLRPSP